MIVTKEQQEAILNKYIKEKHNTDECSGFVDGINATLELVNKLSIPVVVGTLCDHNWHHLDNHSDRMMCVKCDERI